MLNPANYEYGAVVTHDYCDYVVVARNGQKVFKQFSQGAWHPNVHEISCSDTFSEFVTEFISEFDTTFPHSGLPFAKKLELGITLWLKFIKNGGN